MTMFNDFGLDTNGTEDVDSTPTNTAHTAQYSLFKSAERTSRAWLKADPAQELQRHLCAPENNFVILCVAHVLSLVVASPALHHEHIFSFTLPSTTTPEHALQSGQHDPLQEHPVHHQPLQACLVEKHRYQNPLWRENQQSGGNLRNTFSTGYEPKELATKELATVSRISRITDPFQLYDAQKEFGKEDHRAPITEEAKDLEKLGHTAYRITYASIQKYQRRPMSNRTCTSTIPWKALQILISKMESYERC